MLLQLMLLIQKEQGCILLLMAFAKRRTIT
jgi:hypothetical protein